MVKGQRKALIYLIYAAVAAGVLVPLSWIVGLSMKTIAEIYGFPVKWFPEHLNLNNYIYIATNTVLLRQLLNSVIVTGGTTSITIVIASLAAYGVSRGNFKESTKTILLVSLLALQFLPGVTNIIPLYFLAKRLELINTHRGLIFILAALRIPFALWILKIYFDTIPVSLEEAALVDGASRLKVLYAIFMPLALPGLAAASFITAVSCWNIFLLPMILIGDVSRQVAVVGVYVYQSYEEVANWHWVAAGTLLATLPILILYVVLQKLFISGLTGGYGK